MTGERGTRLAGELREWDAGALADLRDEYLAFLEQRGESALERDGGPEHVTASCFVLSPNLAQVLLCFHRKGRFWVQLGGHVEPGDGSVAAAASARRGRRAAWLGSARSASSRWISTATGSAAASAGAPATGTWATALSPIPTPH